MNSAMPRDSPSSALPPGFTKLAVPLLFSALANWALFGVLCVQVYVYSYNFPEDKRMMKLLAYLVFLIETVQTCLTGADIYYWFIEGFGDIERFKNSHYAPIDLPLMHAVISFTVQEYFCYRIWALTRDTRSSLFCLVIASVSIVQMVGATWGGISSIVLGKYAVSKGAFYMWAVGSIVVDVLIAIGMTMIFRKARVNAGRFTNFALLRVVRLTVETNALTTSVVFTAFVLFLAFPNEIYYIFPIGIIGKMYSNTLLVSLNNRIYFRDHPSPVVTVHGEGSEHGVMSNTPRTAIAVRVTQVKQPSSRTTLTGDNFEMGVISHMKEDLEMAKVNGYNIN